MNASEKYHQKAEKIEEQLAQIKLLLQAHKGQATGTGVDWADVGDLGYVTEQLAEVVSFLVGEAKANRIKMDTALPAWVDETGSLESWLG